MNKSLFIDQSPALFNIQYKDEPQNLLKSCRNGIKKSLELSNIHLNPIAYAIK